MYTHTRRLPVVFTPLDVESKTKPVATVICPFRGELMTVSNCGNCPRFARIEFTADSKPLLACGGTAATSPTLQQLVKLPTVCAAEDTTLATLQHHLEPEMQQDCVPVLDRRARPVGLARIPQLTRELANASQLDTPLSKLATAQLLRASPETTVAEAQRLLIATGLQELVVVSHDGTFMGLVRARDLTN